MVDKMTLGLSTLPRIHPQKAFSAGSPALMRSIVIDEVREGTFRGEHVMGLFPVSENTFHRHQTDHDSRASRAAALLTTLLTMLILVALGALVVNYMANARPQVATAAHSVPDDSSQHADQFEVSPAGA